MVELIKNNVNAQYYTVFISIILALGVVFFIKFLTGRTPSHAKIYMEK